MCSVGLSQQNKETYYFLFCHLKWLLLFHAVNVYNGGDHSKMAKLLYILPSCEVILLSEVLR